VGPRAGLDMRGKSRPLWDSIPKLAEKPFEKPSGFYTTNFEVVRR